MKYLVTYSSKYGSTKKYAQWIAEELNCPIFEATKIKKSDLADNDVIIHGGGLYAGGLSKISVITKNWKKISDKKVVLFSCGLADPTNQENITSIEKGIGRSLSPEMQEKIKQFHFRGGINYSKLTFIHTMMMNMLKKMLLKNGYDKLRQEDKEFLDTFGKQVDFTDKSTITPLIDYVKSL